MSQYHITEYMEVGGLRNISVDHPDAEIMIRPRESMDRARALALAVARIDETQARLERASLSEKDARMRLGRLSGAHEPISMFGKACVREASDGSVWVMRSADEGWSAFGVRFRDWAELAAERPDWRPCGVGVDVTGPFVLYRCLGSWPEARIEEGR